MSSLHRVLAGLASLLPTAPVLAQSLASVQISEGNGAPTSVVHAPGDATRLYVCTSGTGVRLLKHGLLQQRLFLDLRGTVATTGEGLVSLAFHPDYQANGRLFVLYQDLAQQSWVVEYSVSADPDVADPDSAQVVLGPVPQPGIIHNWDCLAFGPDGMLYVATGDGGGANDPDDNAQDLGVLYGKLLRLDVDLPPPHVPPDNPFVGVPGVREEIWAYGLRQPWRISFDRATGDLYIGDVGEGQREEVDFQPAASSGGENYGWRCMEGTRCTGTGTCGCDDPSWVEPVHEYLQDAGRCAIIGGHVYRGAALPALDGAYLFADFCTGRVYSLRHDGHSATELLEWTADLAPCAGDAPVAITTFGEDALGELYFTTLPGGRLLKLVPEGRTSFNYCVGAPNSVGPGARIAQTGSTLVGSDDFGLAVEGAVPGQTGIFFQGEGQTMSPFGHGFRCVSGAVYRLYPPVHVAPDGTAAVQLDLGSPPDPAGEILAGSKWNFQFWYRDPAAGAPGFNFSDGLHVEFCP